VFQVELDRFLKHRKRFFDVPAARRDVQLRAMRYEALRLLPDGCGKEYVRHRPTSLQHAAIRQADNAARTLCLWSSVSRSSPPPNVLRGAPRGSRRITAYA